MRIGRVAAAAAIVVSMSSGAFAEDNPFGQLLGGLLKEAVKSALESQTGTAKSTNTKPALDPRTSLASLDPMDLSDELAGQLIAQGVYDKPADAVGGRCGDVFDVTSVEVVDRQTKTDYAQLDAIISVSPKVNVGASTIILCFGIMTNTGWRAGGNDVMQGTYEFELWDSGWRLMPQRRR